MTKHMRIVSAILIAMLVFLNMNIYFAADSKTNTNKDVIIPVLMYHNLAEEYPKGSEGANITPELFEEHMQGILDKGYTPIFVADYYDSVQNGTPLPQNPIIVTFDDGYLSNYEIAFPILKRLNIPATIFIVTSTVGAKAEDGMVSTSHFTWEQAKEMQESGIIDIHSHSHTHKNMTQISPAQLQEELRLSKYLIEKNLGKSCFVFSYPFGGYNETTSRLANFAGYSMQILVNYAESGEDYLANNTKSGIEHFTRLTISGDMTVKDLFDIIDLAVENTKKLG
ncbi:MAG: polysaccharide deacetylase family protein [Clostridia bacterium]|nr:polysaccharide deacetylase family protein [Clostridia bacterium]